MNFFHNPFVKTILSVGLGAIAPVIDAHIQSPTGGTAAALASSPVYSALWLTGSLLIHNLISATQYQQK